MEDRKGLPCLLRASYDKQQPKCCFVKKSVFIRFMRFWGETKSHASLNRITNIGSHIWQIEHIQTKNRVSATCFQIFNLSCFQKYPHHHPCLTTSGSGSTIFLLVLFLSKSCCHTHMLPLLFPFYHHLPFLIPKLFPTIWTNTF